MSGEIKFKIEIELGRVSLPGGHIYVAQMEANETREVSFRMFATFNHADRDQVIKAAKEGLAQFEDKVQNIFKQDGSKDLE